jgi:threonine/homoserine/homoserine lactone efflux protein
MVTLIIANSLAHGTRAGFLNVAGAQIAVALMITTLVLGLSSVVATVGWLFDWVRILGAAYLIWLGWKLLRSTGGIDAPGSAPTPRIGFFLQGFLVMASNPKTLLFFGAFIPQFVDPSRNAVSQVVVLGLTAMAVGIVSDGAYAVITGRTGALLSRRRVLLLNRISGLFLIGGGAWLALTRVR